MISRALLLVGVIVILAACSGDDGPAALSDVSASPTGTPDTPTATPTPVATPTPTVEPPDEPSNAHDYSEEGVEAFTRYAIDVINYAYQTNDVAPLEQIMTPDCEFCARTVEQLTTIHSAGGHIEGGQLKPDDTMSVSGPSEGVQTSAGVELIITASRIVDGGGEVTNTEEDRDRYYIFNLLREEDEWRLDEVFRTND